MAITVLDVAVARGAKQGADGSINGGEFHRLGLPFFGGCLHCHASIAAYNAYPTKTGYLMCKDCCESSEQGYSTVEEFEAEDV